MPDVREISLIGWIGEHPGDGGDVAHFLLYPTVGRGIAEGMDLLAERIGLAPAAGDRMPRLDPRAVLVVLTAGSATLRLSAEWAPTIPVDREWEAAARARKYVCLSISLDPPPAPGLAGVDALAERPERLRCGLAACLTG